MSTRILVTCKGAMLGGAALLTIAGAPAFAQTFCPAGFTQANGFCTNGVTGAFSSAALSSSALTEVSTAATQQSTNTTSEAIRRRRDEEERRPSPAATPASPSQATAARPAPEAPRQATAPRPAPAAPRQAAPRPAPAAPRQATAPRPARVSDPEPARPAVAMPYYKAPPIEYGPRHAVWLQAFGDYERFQDVGGRVEHGFAPFEHTDYD